MQSCTRHQDTLALGVRWIARISSIVWIGVLLLFFIGEADLGQPIELSPQEWVLLLFFPLGIVAGMVVAWRREGLGAGVTLGSLLSFYITHLLFSSDLPDGPFFVIFASPGIVFFASWLLSHRTRRAKGNWRP